jgi:CarD family transcriptional regulator
MNRSFRIGELAVYPTRGVTQVLGIESREVSGIRQTFYHLRVASSDERIFVPISKAHSIGLRPLISREEVPKVFEFLKTRPVKIVRQNWNRRLREYNEKLMRGSIYDVAEVMRELYYLRYQKMLSFGEKKVLETARDLLVGEIAAVTEQDVTKVQEQVESLFPAEQRAGAPSSVEQ